MSRRFNHRRYTRRHIRSSPFSEGNLHNSYDFRKNTSKKKIFYWSIFFIVLLFLFVSYKDNIFIKVEEIKQGIVTSDFANENVISENIDGEKEIDLRNEARIEKKILELVNEERARNGVRALTSNSKLNNLARQHSDKMMNENFFEHSGDNVGENIGETPIHYAVIGCGATYTDNAIASCMVNGWIGSPGHHQNMIDVTYGITGVGVSCDISKCRGTQNFL